MICAVCRTLHEDGELSEDVDRDCEVAAVAGAKETGGLEPDYDEVWGDSYEEESLTPCEACGDKEPGERFRFDDGLDEPEDEEDQDWIDTDVSEEEL